MVFINPNVTFSHEKQNIFHLTLANTGDIIKLVQAQTASDV